MRERLHGLLMLALYRDGQQSEALACYQHVRRVLMEELGTGPGLELRQAEQQILARDPALDWPAPTRSARQQAAVAVVVVPRQLLAPVRAHQVAGRFPDGQLYANLHGFDPSGTPAEPAAVIRTFLDALGVPAHQVPGSEQGQQGLYRSQLTSLAAGEDAHLVTLDVLSAAEARELLTRRLGRERVAAELRDAAARLDALDTGEAEDSVRAVLSWSYRHLSAPAARMLRLLGVHPGPDITAAAAASLAGISLDQARQALNQLNRANLVSRPVPGRFSFHDLLRVYAAERARAEDSETERRAAVRRRWITTCRPRRRPRGSRPSTGCCWPPWTRPSAPAWAEVLTTNQVALAAARRAGDRRGQARAHRNLGHQQGKYGEALGYTQRALSLYQAAGDQAEVAMSLGNIGWCYAKLEDYQQCLVHCQQSAAMYSDIGNESETASNWHNIGYAHLRLGDPAQAISYFRKALEVLARFGDSFGRTMTLIDLGDAYQAGGQPELARAAWQQALAIAEELQLPEAEELRAKLRPGVYPARATPADAPTGVSRRTCRRAGRRSARRSSPRCSPRPRWSGGG
jgi:tetratricopeptide (TPR) repeat protein